MGTAKHRRISRSEASGVRVYIFVCEAIPPRVYFLNENRVQTALKLAIRGVLALMQRITTTRTVSTTIKFWRKNYGKTSTPYNRALFEIRAWTGGQASAMMERMVLSNRSSRYRDPRPGNIATRRLIYLSLVLIPPCLFRTAADRMGSLACTGRP